MQLYARGHIIQFPRRPLIMGIININDDSFSGDGRPGLACALERAAILVEQGADVIDVGGESARTNRPAITEAEETRRLLPFVERFDSAVRGLSARDHEQHFPPLLSINTWRMPVANATLAAGGDILNDMSGLPSADNARICARHGAALVIMHTVGMPKTPHTHVKYSDVLVEMREFFSNKLEVARAAGVPMENILLDPGIDFAKQRGDNLAIYRNLRTFAGFDRPIVLPVSRKTVIGECLGLPDPNERDPGTVACIVAGALRGASVFRVHNVDACLHALRTVRYLAKCAVPELA